jgi:hypothetical protein
MEQSPLSGDNIHPVSQVIRCILSTRVQNSQLPASLLSQTNAIYMLTPYFFRSFLVLSHYILLQIFRPNLSLPRGLLAATNIILDFFTVIFFFQICVLIVLTYGFSSLHLFHIS